MGSFDSKSVNVADAEKNKGKKTLRVFGKDVEFSKDKPEKVKK